MDFHMENHGTTCGTSGNTQGHINAQTDDDGNTNGTVTATNNSSTTCTPLTRAYYTVKIADHTYVLMPAPSLERTGVALFTLGVGTLFFRDSALYGVLPGTPIKVSADGGTFHVKVEKRESAYKLESAQ